LNLAKIALDKTTEMKPFTLWIRNNNHLMHLELSGVLATED